jgi:formyltetrahydrofolate dehydrogenase
MIIKVLGDKNTIAHIKSSELVRNMGHVIDYGSHFVTDVQIAPLLTVKISEDEIYSPLHGTLIFHPSPLPYGRGASSIRWAYKRKEPITAATWFWANDNLDAGDICEQEIIKIDYNLSPKEFYESHIIPAMLRTLERCLKGLEKGIKREIKQIEDYATYDSKI